MLWIAAALTMLTGYDYLRAGLIHMDAAPTERPVPPSVEPRRVT